MRPESPWRRHRGILPWRCTIKASGIPDVASSPSMFCVTHRVKRPRSARAAIRRWPGVGRAWVDRICSSSVMRGAGSSWNLASRNRSSGFQRDGNTAATSEESPLYSPRGPRKSAMPAAVDTPAPRSARTLVLRSARASRTFARRSVLVIRDWRRGRFGSGAPGEGACRCDALLAGARPDIAKRWHSRERHGSAVLATGWRHHRHRPRGLPQAMPTCVALARGRGSNEQRQPRIDSLTAARAGRKRCQSRLVTVD